MTSGEPADLAVVVGANVRRLRVAAGVTLDQLAQVARSVGLPLTASSAADLERGRRAPQLGTLVQLALALGRARGQTVRLADLLEDQGRQVALGEGWVAEPGALSLAVRGRPVTDHGVGPGPGVAVAQGVRMTAQQLQAELAAAGAQGLTLAQVAAAETLGVDLAATRAAQRLGVPVRVVALAAQQLWGRSLTAERDWRARPGSSAQARGRVTRQLVAELGQHLAQVADT